MSFSLFTERLSLDAIRLRTQLTPHVGIILGSGLGNLAKAVEHPTIIAYEDIPGFPKLTAVGHIGQLIIGQLGNTPVVVMRGRAHLYEGHDPVRATYGVRIMHAMGAHTLIVSNAAGGLNPRLRVGDLVLLDGHIDLMHRSGLVNPKTDLAATPPCPSESVFANNNDSPIRTFDIPGRTGPVYDRSLLDKTSRCAIRLGSSLPRGTYLATLGPTYETRAEYRAFRMLGADMVGMSTVPETILAATLGMKVIAFSVITNVASPDIAVATTHDDVLESADKAQSQLTSILIALLTEIA